MSQVGLNTRSCPWVCEVRESLAGSQSGRRLAEGMGRAGERGGVCPSVGGEPGRGPHNNSLKPTWPARA